MRRIIPALIIAAISCSAMAAPKAIHVDAQGKPHYNHLHNTDSILDVKHNELWAKDHVRFIDKEIDSVSLSDLGYEGLTDEILSKQNTKKVELNHSVKDDSEDN